MDRFPDRETRPVTLDEAVKLAGMPPAGKGSPEPDTIGDDLCRRILNIDNHLLILDERLSSMATKVMGMQPETDTIANGEGITTLKPPLIERLSSGIFSLERRAMQIERTIDRFSGLV
jgi:hypothetical protein